MYYEKRVIISWYSSIMLLHDTLISCIKMNHVMYKGNTRRKYKHKWTSTLPYIQVNMFFILFFHSLFWFWSMHLIIFWYKTISDNATLSTWPSFYWIYTVYIFNRKSTVTSVRHVSIGTTIILPMLDSGSQTVVLWSCFV